MNDDLETRDVPLSVEALKHIDRVCLEFEAAWRTGPPPSIEDYLGDVQGSARSRLFCELLLLELDYLRRRGEQPSVEEYHARLPGDVRLIDEVFEGRFKRVTARTIAAPPPGTRVHYFGDYELLEEIGRGGMGIVYKARQLSLNRVVAVKLILAGHLASRTDVARFHREAETAANLQHPNIVAIHEVGEHEGQHYFSMDYIEGRSLAEVVRDSPLSARRAAQYVTTIAEAVHYAHGKHTLHRDLKPANILIDQADQPRITDFGLAKRVEADSALTGSDRVLGTPSYMPPEQASTTRGEIGPASDVYALGAILYELIVGRAPFKAETPTDTLLQVLDTEPVSPRELNPKVPRDLETICLKCLHKDPQRRYESAAALRDDLDRWLSGKPITARPVGTTERWWRWCKRNPVVAGLMLAVAVSLVSGMGVSTYFAVEANRRAAEALSNEKVAKEEKRRADDLAVEADLRAAEALENERTAKEEKRRADDLAAESRRHAAEAIRNEKIAKEEELRANRERDVALRRLYISDIQLAHRAWEDRNVLHMQSLLEAHQETEGQSDLRGWEWYYLRSLCSEDQATFRGHKHYVESVAWSPDGRRVASASKDGTVKIWNPNHPDTPVTMEKDGDYACGLSWSREGKHLLATPRPQWKNPPLPRWQDPAPRGVPKVTVWEVTAGRLLLNAEGRMGAWSPDGKRVGYVGTDEKLRVWEEATGKTAEFSAGLGPLACFAWSPDATQCIVVGQNALARFLDATTGELGKQLDRREGPVDVVLWSRDGKRIALAGSGRSAPARPARVDVFDAATGEPQYTLASHSRGPAWGMAWSPDSRWLVTVGGGFAAAGSLETVKVWDAASGKEVASLEGVTAVWSLDCSQLATTLKPNCIALWKVPTWEQCRTFSGHASEVYSLDWHPDGRQLASGGGDATVKIWNVAEQRSVRELPGERLLAWSPDGKLLAVVQSDNSISVFEIADGKEVVRLQDHSSRPNTLAWCPLGRKLAWGSYDLRAKTGELFVFDLAAKEPIRRLPGNKGVSSLAWSPDGERLAVCGPPLGLAAVRVIRVKDGQECLSLHSRKLYGLARVAWSGDGRRLATSGLRPGRIQLWDARTGDEICAFRGSALSLAFSTDGRRLASGGGGPHAMSGQVIIWNVGTGEKVRVLRGHNTAVRALAWSDDDTRLATAGGEQVIIWDTTIGQELLSVDAHKKGISCLAFSPDGRLLTAAGYEPTIKIWDATAGYERSAPLPSEYFETYYKGGGFF